MGMELSDVAGGGIELVVDTLDKTAVSDIYRTAKTQRAVRRGAPPDHTQLQLQRMPYTAATLIGASISQREALARLRRGTPVGDWNSSSTRT